MLDDFSGIEHHRKTFATVLRVPDDTRPTVARGARGFNRLVDGVELMIARQLLQGRSIARLGRPGVFKHDEVSNQVQQAVLVEHAFEQRFQMQEPTGKLLARDGAPRHEPLPIRRNGSKLCLVIVGNHQQGIRVEQRRDLSLISLQLIERGYQARENCCL